MATDIQRKTTLADVKAKIHKEHIVTKIRDKEYKELLKQNAMKISENHKRTCNDPECDISVLHLGVLVRMAGIELTEEELRSF